MWFYINVYSCKRPSQNNNFGIRRRRVQKKIKRLHNILKRKPTWRLQTKAKKARDWERGGREKERGFPMHGEVFAEVIRGHTSLGTELCPKSSLTSANLFLLLAISDASSCHKAAERLVHSRLDSPTSKHSRRVGDPAQAVRSKNTAFAKSLLLAFDCRNQLRGGRHKRASLTLPESWEKREAACDWRAVGLRFAKWHKRPIMPQGIRTEILWKLANGPKKSFRKVKEREASHAGSLLAVFLSFPACLHVPGHPVQYGNSNEF